MQPNQEPKTYRVRITDPCRYCPEGGKSRELEVGDEVDMQPEDAHNVVSSGRGVFVKPDEVTNTLKRAGK